MGHVLMENRHGLVVDGDLTEASGTAERDTAVDMLAVVASGLPCSVCALRTC